MSIAKKLLALDRRIIFVLVAASIILPLYLPLGLPVSPDASPPVKGVFGKMESMDHDSSLLLSMDFDPTSKPELLPMTKSILRHAFARDIKVVGMTLWLTGTGMAEEALKTVASEFDREYGVDYVFLGWQVQPYAVIINMGQALHGTWPKDYYGTPIDRLPIMTDLKSLKDFDYVTCLAAGDPGIAAWYAYGAEKHGFTLGAGCTGVSASAMYPLLQAGQLNGLIAGIKGAAEYETLLNTKGVPKALGEGTAGMDAMSVSHMVIIAFVILGNILYVIASRRARQ